jgi:hypothetical protein
VALGLHKEMLGWLSLEVALVCLDRMLPSEDEGEENLCFVGKVLFLTPDTEWKRDMKCRGSNRGRI